MKMETTEATITRLGSHPGFGSETMQVEKRGGELGDVPRYYVISHITREDIENSFPLDAIEFVDMVDALGPIVGRKMGTSGGETLAFRISAPNVEPDDWGEVAGYPWNGASIEQVIEEVLRNEEL